VERGQVAPRPSVLCAYVVANFYKAGDDADFANGDRHIGRATERRAKADVWIAAFGEVLKETRTTPRTQ
jgi:hypothetical protein